MSNNPPLSPLHGLTATKRTPGSTAPLQPVPWQRDDLASACKDCNAAFGLSRR
jgi:hypothetical protein